MLKLSLLLSVALCSFAQAQVIFQPVQYQYGSGNDTYYYGGSDPAVFAKAERTAAARQIRGVADTKPQVYSDAVPHQPNAAVYGVTAADARNQAYAAMPNYFRKGDLVGHPQADGSIVVPPTAGGEIVIPKPAAKPLAPATKRGVIIIIPKPASDKQVASAQ
jgi:hypothetical protein